MKTFIRTCISSSKRIVVQRNVYWILKCGKYSKQSIESIPRRKAHLINLVKILQNRKVVLFSSFSLRYLILTSSGVWSQLASFLQPTKHVARKLFWALIFMGTGYSVVIGSRICDVLALLATAGIYEISYVKLGSKNSSQCHKVQPAFSCW